MTEPEYILISNKATLLAALRVLQSYMGDDENVSVARTNIDAKLNSIFAEIRELRGKNHTA